VHLSTDYVFDGRAVRPYREEDAPCPLGVYGRSKLAGEHALGAIEAPAVVLRTAWLYSLRRPSFVSTILRLGAARSELRVVDDQLGSPTFCRDLAAVLALWLRQLGPQPADAIDALRGVYHLAGDGVASRHELATAAVALHPRREALAVRRIVPIASADFRQRAPRPRYGALDCGLFAARFGLRLPPWREALARALVDAAER
jgi:dTDP-4-dehydrorhamnose reductase